jgi:hypothetical protein
LHKISLFRALVLDQDTHNSVQNELHGQRSVHSRSLKPTAARYQEFPGKRLLFLACLDVAALSFGRLPIRRSSVTNRLWLQKIRRKPIPV